MANANEIFRTLETRIRQGDLASGEKLPAVRDLAVSLRVDKNTVLAAYAKLRDAGLTRSQGRGGTVVAESLSVVVPHARTLPTGVLDLTHGNPDPALLPTGEDLLRISGAKLRKASPHLYDGVQVYPRLFEWALEWFKSDGLPAAQIAVTGGAMDAVDRVLRLHVRKGEAVAIESPSFPATPSLVRSLGLRVLEYEVDSDGPVAASLGNALKAGAQAVVFSSRGQNPTGGTVTQSRAGELSKLVREHGRRVLWIDDDHFSLLSESRYRPWHVAKEGSWATVRSFSKFLGPDLRLAVCTGDTETLRGLCANQWLSQRWQSHLLQRLCVGLLTDTLIQRKIKTAGQVYRDRRRALAKALGAAGMPVSPGEGLNLWLPLKGADQLAAWLLGRGIAIRSGKDFDGGRGEGIRITYSALDAGGLALLASALKDWQRISWDVAQA